MYKVKDKFGRTWEYPDGVEYCPECHQPDTTGECRCSKISTSQYRRLTSQMKDNKNGSGKI
jgi:hypothetical protein